MSKEFWQRLILAVFILFIFFIMIFFNKSDQSKIERKTVKVDGNEIKAEVVRDSVAKAKGLSGREKLASDEGMLFIYNRDGDYSIWMKGMEFAIDILWIKDNQVVHFEKFVAPDGGKKIYRSTVKANRILEVSAGFVENHNIGIGAEFEE